jgi:membrane protease subunit (stomatin/prohibitin family)
VLTIAGLFLLIFALVLGVKGIFKGLEAVLPTPAQADQSVADDVSSQDSQTDQAAPSYCTYCGKKLPDSFQWGQFCPYCGEQVEQ